MVPFLIWSAIRDNTFSTNILGYHIGPALNTTGCLDLLTRYRYLTLKRTIYTTLAKDSQRHLWSRLLQLFGLDSPGFIPLYG